MVSGEPRPVRFFIVPFLNPPVFVFVRLKFVSVVMIKKISPFSFNSLPTLLKSQTAFFAFSIIYLAIKDKLSRHCF